MTGGKGKGKAKGKGKGKDKKRNNKKRTETFEPRSLPDDAITEILLRFPVRSVLRFRSVSKVWCAKIDSPEFKKKHLSYQLARARYDENEFLVVNRDYSMRSDNFSCRMNVLSCYDDYKSLSDLNSSCELDIRVPYFSSFSYQINGIVCVFHNGDDDIYLCNPALREIRRLPEFPSFPVEFGITDSYRLSGVGIGFDAAAYDFTVVQFLHPSGDAANNLKCVEYHLKAQSWSEIQFPPGFVSTHASTFQERFTSSNKLYASLFSHGCIHWCLEWNLSILTFNTTTRSFEEIEFPHGWKDNGYDEYVYLLEFDSSASIALFGYRGRDLHNIDIWVMKEYGVADSWTKQYFISDYTIPGLPPSMHGLPRISRPLCFWRKDKVFLLTLGSTVICYDLGKDRLYGPPLRGQTESLPDMKGMKPVKVLSGGQEKLLFLPDPDADTDSDTDTDTDETPQDDHSSLPHPDMTTLEVVTCSGSLISVYHT